MTNTNQYNNTCQCGNTINSPCHDVCVHCAHAGVYECDSCGRGMQTDSEYCASCEDYQHPTPSHDEDAYHYDNDPSPYSGTYSEEQTMYTSVDTQAVEQRSTLWSEIMAGIRSLSNEEFATFNTTLTEKQAIDISPYILRVYELGGPAVALSPYVPRGYDN